MRILLSASDFTNASNGLARSARDFCAGLRARGHEVRVISYGDSSHVDYPLQRLSIPFFDRYISAEDFNIARPDRSIFEAALKWAQILYVEDPLPANTELVRVARRFALPIVGSFMSIQKTFWLLFLLSINLYSTEFCTPSSITRCIRTAMRFTHQQKL